MRIHHSENAAIRLNCIYQRLSVINLPFGRDTVIR